MSTGLSAITSQAVKTAAATGTMSKPAQSQQDKDRQTIAQNFDQFLSLLTTQLRNQSPLDPLDANQFTQQLVQFSGVEQQLKTNDLLAKMSASFGQGGGAGGKLTAASAASLIGVQVSADASKQRLSPVGDAGEQRASFPVRTQSNYTDYQVSITDENGNSVYSGSWNPPGAGDQMYVWDGRRTDGSKVDPSKTYTAQVTGALVADPRLRSVMSSERSGVVTSVDISGSEEMVTFGAFTVPVSRIKRVAQAGV
jgi:flagellar basal-body rod modification protein FlgD